MEHHGSKSYYVLGEGLITESRGGRDAATRTLASAGSTAAAPPFRFSRLGPKGTGKQLAEANRRKIAEAMTAGGQANGTIGAGFTYLGQFIDHDLTFDKTSLMEGADIDPPRSRRAARRLSTSTASKQPDQAPLDSRYRSRVEYEKISTKQPNQRVAAEPGAPPPSEGTAREEKDRRD